MRTLLANVLNLCNASHLLPGATLSSAAKLNPLLAPRADSPLGLSRSHRPAVYPVPADDDYYPNYDSRPPTPSDFEDSRPFKPMPGPGHHSQLEDAERSLQLDKLAEGDGLDVKGRLLPFASSPPPEPKDTSLYSPLANETAGSFAEPLSNISLLEQEGYRCTKLLTQEATVKQVKKTAVQAGRRLVIDHSRTNHSSELRCAFGPGKHTPKFKTTKGLCPFLVKVVRAEDGQSWTAEIIEGRHNADCPVDKKNISSTGPSNFSEAELLFMKQHAFDMGPTAMLKDLNEKRRIAREKKEGDYLFRGEIRDPKLISDRLYAIRKEINSTTDNFAEFATAFDDDDSPWKARFQINASSDCTGLFFMLPESIAILQRYQYCLQIDATHKTNSLHWPLVQISAFVGGSWVTPKAFEGEGKEDMASDGRPAAIRWDHSIDRSFVPVGFALIQHEDETSYDFVLSHLKEFLDGRVPETIVTDQDLALIKAVENHFPDTTRLQCAWHASENVKMHANKAGFQGAEIVNIVDQFKKLMRTRSKDKSAKMVGKLIGFVEGLQVDEGEGDNPGEGRVSQGLQGTQQVSAHMRFHPADALRSQATDCFICVMTS